LPYALLYLATVGACFTTPSRPLNLATFLGRTHGYQFA
jgi:hypothetical protein